MNKKERETQMLEQKAKLKLRINKMIDEANIMIASEGSVVLIQTDSPIEALKLIEQNMEALKTSASKLIDMIASNYAEKIVSKFVEINSDDLK